MQGIASWGTLGAGRHRRRRPDRVAEVERLEDRLVLDSGASVALVASASAADTSLPPRFASAAEWTRFRIDAAVDQWRWQLGKHFPRYPDVIALPFVEDGPALPRPAPPLALAAASVAHSGTNNQVQGVDEGDVVETDGRFLYILSGRALKIVDARQPDALALVSRTDLGGGALAAHLDGTRLTVIAREDGVPGDPVPTLDPGIARVALLPFVASPPKLKVTEFDVANAATPRVPRTTTLDGYYVASRAVGDRVYVVVEHNLDSLPPPQTLTTDTEIIYPTEEEYRAQLEAVDIVATLPQFTSEANGSDGNAASSGALLGFDAIHRPAPPEDGALLSVVTFDARRTSPGPAGAVGIVAPYGATVYATSDHLYLAGTRWNSAADGTSSETTLIQKLDLSGDEPTLTAVGTVPGRILNQFALDEHEGHLRVATTSGAWDGAAWHTTNAVYVLAERDGRLEAVGSLTGLAPDESIYAARFFGDRAFLVTFRQVDPLFALDLSDPTSPRAVGELKVPGFSRYLHPVDATHILGIGRDVDPVTNRTSGLQVTLFDVADLANPRAVDSETIAADGWVWSEAEFEHHAVSFFPESGVLAIPVNVQPAYSWDGTAEPAEPRYGLRVLRVDPEGGLTPLGEVRHDAPVLRTVNIGAALFSISHAVVKSSPVLDPSTTLGQVALRGPDEVDEGETSWPIFIRPVVLDAVPAASGPVHVDPTREQATSTGTPADPGPGTIDPTVPAPPEVTTGLAPAPTGDSIPMPLGAGFRAGRRRLLSGRRGHGPGEAVRRETVPRPIRLPRRFRRQQPNPAVVRAMQAQALAPGSVLGLGVSARNRIGFPKLPARRLNS